VADFSEMEIMSKYLFCPFFKFISLEASNYQLCGILSVCVQDLHISSDFPLEINFQFFCYFFEEKRALTRMRVNWREWRFFWYKDIELILNSEHECSLMRLPRTMASMVIFHYSIRSIELTVDNDAFYVRKEWYMASQEGIGKTFTVLSQNSAIVLLLHQYVRFLGAYIMCI
jgi:hypothetical protein